jgi:trehalose synthase-fused probable maltokinase
MGTSATADAVPALVTPRAWEGVLDAATRAALEPALPRYLAGARWFGGKARDLRRVEIVDAVPVPMAPREAHLALLRVSYAEGHPEVYALPLAFASGAHADEVRAAGRAEVAPLEAGGERGVLYAADRERGFARALVGAIAQGKSFAGAEGELAAWPTHAFARLGAGAADLEPAPMSAEQSNTSIRFGERLVLKLFRRTEPGPNPDLEVGAFLTDVAGFQHTPPVLGGIEYRPRRGEAVALAVLQAFVPNQGDAWSFTLGAVQRSLERLRRDPGRARAAAAPPGARLVELAVAEAPAAARDLAGGYLDSARLLGRRTAELHRALGSHPEHAAFAPEPFSSADRAALQASVSALVHGSLALLRQRRGAVPPAAAARADALLAREGDLLARVRSAAERPLTAQRLRTHGDYHLGQVLFTGRDFVIIDFEGEPARPLAARRAKTSPLRDVAGMVRSFHYAAHHGLAAAGEGAERDGAAEEAWARSFYAWSAAAYLGAYLDAARGARFLPSAPGELEALLDLFLVEKAAYELAYELNNRPAWVGLPLQGLAEELGER